LCDDFDLRRRQTLTNLRPWDLDDPMAVLLRPSAPVPPSCWIKPSLSSKPGIPTSMTARATPYAPDTDLKSRRQPRRLPAGRNGVFFYFMNATSSSARGSCCTRAATASFLTCGSAAGAACYPPSEV
jgi:hypothetical protein